MNKYAVFGIAAIVALASIAGFAFLSPFISGQNAAQSGTGYMTQAQVNSINASENGVQVSVPASTIYINSSTVIPVLMGPMNAPSMYSFEIYGLINPNIAIRAGIAVKFVAVNIDDDSYHNFAVSSQGPPYYSMGAGMMGGSYGNGFGGMMSGYYGENSSYAYMMKYLSPQSADGFAFTNVTFTFGESGTYWYLCTYPGHAQQGMYGKIIVN